MKKELPNVYANPFNKKISNVQEIFYGKEKKEARHVDVNDVIRKINQIFASPHHVYKSRVKITTNNAEFETDIVGKANGYLLTLKGENIKVIDILDIEKI